MALIAMIRRSMKWGGGASFLRDIGLLLAGSGGAQAIVVLSAPILSRVYRPEDFAALALLTSAFQIISRFSSLKYETAIATGRNVREMGTLAALATWALFLVSALSLLFSAILLPVLAEKLGWSAAIAFCIALPVIVLFDGLIQIIITWAVRWREFTTVSINDLIRNGTSTATQVGGGLAGMASGGLLFGQVLGTIAAFAVLLRRPSAKYLIGLARKSSWARRRVVARRFIDFPMFQMPKAILNSLARNLPTILVATYFSTASVGLFFFASRLTSLPAQLISQSTGRVLLQRFVTRWTKQQLSIAPLLEKSSLFFLVLSAPLVVVLFLYGEQIFSFFLGPEWRASGSLAAWLVFWSASIIVCTPAQMAMIVLRQNRITLIIEAVFLPLRLVPFPVLAARGDMNGAVAWSSAAGVLYAIVLIGAAVYSARRMAGKRADPAA